LLTLLLLENLKQNAPSRIINVSSTAHTFGDGFKMEQLPNYEEGKHYDPWNAYGRSKLCNLLFTYELQRKLVGTNVSALVVHPGMIRSSLWQHNKLMECFLCKCSTDGAKPSIHGAVDSKFDMKAPTNHAMNFTNRYYVPRCCCVGSARTSPISYRVSLQKELWEKSLEWTNLNSKEFGFSEEEIEENFEPTLIEQLWAYWNIVPCCYSCC